MTTPAWPDGGCNAVSRSKGDQLESPRDSFLYWSDDGDPLALRYKRWKISFLEQHHAISPAPERCDGEDRDGGPAGAANQTPAAARACPRYFSTTVVLHSPRAVPMIKHAFSDPS